MVDIVSERDFFEVCLEVVEDDSGALDCVEDEFDESDDDDEEVFGLRPN